ncbi:MAG: YqgE/AlgH family protein [Muribaculaceae bacterium]
MKETDDIFHLDDLQPEPKRGALLIAKPTVDDTCFSRSVIITVNHNNHGSMGLIVNKLSGITLNEVIENLLTDEEIPLYLGGPVNTELLFYIHTLGDAIPGAKPLTDKIFVGGDYDAMKRYINSGAPINGKVKFILGYSGWAASQLEAEIGMNDWAVSHTCNTRLILSNAQTDIWQKSVKQLGERYKMWLNWPSDLSMN